MTVFQSKLHQVIITITSIKLANILPEKLVKALSVGT